MNLRTEDIMGEERFTSVSSIRATLNIERKRTDSRW